MGRRFSGGPGPEYHMFTNERIEQIMIRKRRSRHTAIERLRAEARRRGESDEIGLWSLIHDLERAPLTTNLRQLSEIGIEMLVESTLDDEELSRSLAEVIEGLSRLDVHLRHTDHLDDRALHRALRDRVLCEPVRDLPAGIGCCEWIDMSGGEDRSAFLAVHASDESRRLAAERGQWVPDRVRPSADRDRALPLPSRGRWSEGGHRS